MQKTAFWCGNLVRKATPAVLSIIFSLGTGTIVPAAVLLSLPEIGMSASPLELVAKRKSVRLEHPAAVVAQLTRPTVDTTSSVSNASAEQSSSASVRQSNVKELMAAWELRYVASIAIPSLGVRAPVSIASKDYWEKRKWDLLEEQMQVGLTLGTVAYPQSSLAGKDGTLIIVGHSSPPTEEAAAGGYGEIFEELPSLSVGDVIIVTSGGQKFTYSVMRSFVTSANDTKILLPQPRSGANLTLITCFPIGSTKQRLVVEAKFVPVETN